MPLDDLVTRVEDLAQRVEQYALLLRQSEMLTRYVLIDPFLRALGWNTEDPDQVRPEYHGADYALIHDGKVRLTVEAKRLDTNLSEGLTQSINYCIQEGTPYFAVTDGRRWEVYETFKAVPLSEKRVSAFDLCGAPFEAALGALCVWRPNIGAAQLVSPLHPVIGEPPFAPSSPPPIPGLTSLADIQVASGTKPPVSIHFPDGSQKPLKYWRDLQVEVVQYLVSKGKLGPGNCPVQKPGAYRHLVHHEPKHSGGEPFGSPSQVGPLWVETHYSARSLVDNTRFILGAVHEDANDYRLPPTPE